MTSVNVHRGPTSKLLLGKRILALILIASFITGCTTLRPVSSEPQAIMAALRPGDDIRVTTRDGRVLEFSVKELTEKAISGANERVAVTDIAQIDQRELSKGRTAGLIGAMAGTAFVVSAIVFFVSIFRNGL